MIRGRKQMGHSEFPFSPEVPGAAGIVHLET